MTSAIQFITALPVSRWQEYKNLRLEALQKEPQAFGSTYQKQSNYSDEAWQQRLANYLAADGNWMVFAEKSSQLIGMVGAFQLAEHKKNEVAEIMAMYVVPAERGQGLGKALLQVLLNTLKATATVKRVQLGVHVQEVVPIKLYTELGFTICDRKFETMENGTECEIFTMAKEL